MNWIIIRAILHRTYCCRQPVVEIKRRGSCYIIQKIALVINMQHAMLLRTSSYSSIVYQV